MDWPCHEEAGREVDNSDSWMDLGFRRDETKLCSVLDRERDRENPICLFRFNIYWVLSTRSRAMAGSCVSIPVCV